MKTRAAILATIGLPQPYARSRPLAVETVELEPPGAGEVLVRVKAAGLCHSDLSVINGDRVRPVPMVLGHEAAGVVEALGPGVDDLAVDDHVVMVFVPSCGHCLPCAEGRPALCEPAFAANSAGTLLSGARRLSRNGAALNHLLGVAAFAEHVTVSRRSLVKVDRSLPFEHAALFGCAVLTGVGAVVNTAALKSGQTAAIVGLGGVGLAGLLGAVAAGASKIVAVDVNPDKLALARKLGATHTVNGRDTDAVDQVKAATGGGVDFAFDFAGSVQALETAYRVTRRGGTTVSAGLPNPTHSFPLPALNLVAEERTLKGSYIGTCVPLRDVPRYVALFQQGKLPVDKLLTGKLKLDEINEGFDRLAAGEAIRQVVVFP
ncbi:MAG: zinc-dependent alcohol dehydrogenase family protein [Gammaproteobacteria bacterium]